MEKKKGEGVASELAGIVEAMTRLAVTDEMRKLTARRKGQLRGLK